MKFRPDILTPPGIFVEDVSVIYRRQLRQAQQRQQERDEMHMAWIDNLFHGEEYKSMFEEFPDLMEQLPITTRELFKKQILDVGHPKYDASHGE